MKKINISKLIRQPIEDDSDFNTDTAGYYDIQFDLNSPVDEDKLEKFWNSVEEDLESDPLW